MSFAHECALRETQPPVKFDATTPAVVSGAVHIVQTRQDLDAFLGVEGGKVKRRDNDSMLWRL